MNYRDMLDGLHKKVNELGCKVESGPIMDFPSGTVTVVASVPGAISPESHRAIMHNGARIAVCQVPVFVAKEAINITVLARYFKLFDDVPAILTDRDMIQEYAVLGRVDFDRLPPYRDLIRRMSATTHMVEAENLTLNVLHQQNKIKCAEFYAENGRFPFNWIEAASGSPMKVRLSRFGVEIPYFVPVPMLGRSMVHNNGFLKDDGVYDVGGNLALYKMSLKFDPKRQEFREEGFFDWPYKDSHDGALRFKARVTAREEVQVLADSLELVMGDALSLNGFSMLARLFEATCPRHTGHITTTYDSACGVLQIQMPDTSM